MFRANKITNPDTQESCYPDLTFNIKGDTGRYEEKELIDAKAYKSFLDASQQDTNEYIYVVFDENEYEIKSFPLDDGDEDEMEHQWTSKLSDEMNCSETMETSLKSVIHYLSNKSENLNESLTEIYKNLTMETELLCRSRSEGKRVLNTFTRMAIDYPGSREVTEKFTEHYEYSRPFSHIYVEKEIRNNPETCKIIAEFPNANIIEINDCKDVFFRKNQDVMSQHKSRQLILATQHAKMLYKGAPVCQNFGNEHFYYTSCVKNCIFDCEYCYLKGMYPSGNVVVYVDLDRIFEEVQEKLKDHPMYICISYDTDLMAFEEKIHFVERWIDFCIENPDLRIEIRTKSANKMSFSRLKKCDRAIFAFTLSPDEVVSAYEKNTPGLLSRVECAKYALENGYSVRLCFDPMIYVSDWEKKYKRMLDLVSENIDMQKIMDASVGGFRISSSYLRKMRKIDSKSEIIWFPYDNIDGYYQYPMDIQEEMIKTFEGWLGEKIDKSRIYL